MKRYRFRSAVTGRWVTRLLAKCLPWLTVRERVTRVGNLTIVDWERAK